MKSVPREIRVKVKEYVKFELERGREIYPGELNEFLERKCGIRVVDPEFSQELITQAKKDIRFVYLKEEEEVYE